MIFRSSRLLLYLAAFLLFSAPFAAADVHDWSLEQLSEFSTLVVRGRVVDATPYWDRDLNTIYTYVTVDVAETWKGEAPGSQIVVKMLGGRLEDLELRISGTPEVAVGDDVAWWLEVRPRDRTLYPAAVTQGIRQLRDFDAAGIDTMRAAAAASTPRFESFVAMPTEFRLDAAYTFLPPSEWGPGRWHDADLNIPVTVDYEAFQSGRSVDDLNDALSRWNTSGMNLQLQRGSVRSARCAATYVGDGRISVNFTDPCGEVAGSGSAVGIGGAYMTPVYQTINAQTFVKIVQGFVVMPVNGSSAIASRGCFQDALTHNIGHAIGLGHSTAPTAVIMQPNPSGSCGSQPRQLGDDDRAGARAIYPTGLPFSPPGTPTNLTVSVSGSTVSLNWTAPTLGGPITTYVIEAGSVPGAANLANVPTGSTATAVTFTDVPSGFYYIRVRARNSAGTGNPSNEVTAAINYTLPGAPTGLSATVTGTTVVLNWTAPSTGVVSNYIVEAGFAPGLSNAAVAVFPGTQTSVGFGDVPFGTYYVRVRARNALGNSPPSNEIVVNVACPALQAPTNLAFTKSGTVTFTWQAPPGGGVSTYYLVVGSAPGASNLLVANVGNTTTMTASGPPGTYYVRVMPSNACSNGPMSNEVEVKIP